MAKFAFTDPKPVKLPRSTTGSVYPDNDINKDVSSARLLPAILSQPILWIESLKTPHCCLYPNERYNSYPAMHQILSHPPTPIMCNP